MGVKVKWNARDHTPSSPIPLVKEHSIPRTSLPLCWLMKGGLHQPEHPNVTVQGGIGEFHELPSFIPRAAAASNGKRRDVPYLPLL